MLRLALVLGRLLVAHAFLLPSAVNKLFSTLARLVWRSGISVRYINEVKLHRTQLVLVLVITFGGSNIPVFNQVTQANSAWPSLRG